MPSSGMLRCVALVKTDISEERSTSIIRVMRISDQGNSVVNYQPTKNARKYCVTHSHPDDGGATSLRNVGSHKSHTA
jgi:hypothetical protein